MKNMKSKHYIRMALLFAIAFTLTVLATPKAADAETYEPVSVNKVEDITSDFSGVGYTISKNLDFSAKTGAFTDVYYYTFTLDSPSYILLKEYASLWQYNFNGDIKYYISSSQVFNEEAVLSEWCDGRDGSYSSLYEAGTYYIKVEIIFESKESRYFNTSPYYNFSIFAQAVERTGLTDGNSQSSAIAVKSGTVIKGIISKQNPKQYFTVKQSATGAFKTEIVASVPVGWNVPSLTATLYTETGAEVSNYYLGGYSTNNVTISIDSLTKGNYYILLSTSTAADDKKGTCTISVNASYQNSTKLAAPKLKSYKVGAKKITGTAPKGSKVTVKVGSTSYKANAKKGKFTIKLKSALKKGTTIKVKATKSGSKPSKTVTYKI